MKLKLCIIASLLMLNSTTLFADVSIPYGEGPGKVDFINNNKYPKIDDPQPSGPFSFRVIGSYTWVADSVGDKIMKFDKDGTLLSEFSVLPEGTKPFNLDKYKLPIFNMCIADFAPVLDQKGEVSAWWIADVSKRKLVKFSADGKKLAEVTHDKFGQLYRIEVGKGGHIFVADKIAKAIFTFDADGKFVKEENWQWSGMAVSGTDDILYRLMYDEVARRNILVASNLKGKIFKEQMLDAFMFNPKLWWIDELKGECLVTYSEPKFDGNYHVLRFNLDDGKVIARGIMPAPLLMNRFIDNNKGDVYIGKGNFFTAPEGNFEVVPYKLPDKKIGGK